MSPIEDQISMQAAETTIASDGPGCSGWTFAGRSGCLVSRRWLGTSPSSVSCYFFESLWRSSSCSPYCWPRRPSGFSAIGRRALHTRDSVENEHGEPERLWPRWLSGSLSSVRTTGGGAHPDSFRMPGGSFSPVSRWDLSSWSRPGPHLNRGERARSAAGDFPHPFVWRSAPTADTFCR